MTIIRSEREMREFGAHIGANLMGGEVIQLVGDVGAGKTTLVKGIAQGLEITDDIQSPSYTISRVYDARDKLRLAHYDFYRLNEAGVMTYEFEEDVNDPATVTIIEWAEVVKGVLPPNHVTISIRATTETERDVTVDDSHDVLSLQQEGNV